MISPSIAIVGMACVYPDARSPGELWENVLAQRRAFRRMPPERLRLEDYFSTDANAPDTTYATEVAVIEGYEFDRVAFRIVGSTFRAADLAHWLALDVTSRALADAGFTDGHELPHTATGVLLGNTLTGEFSRANTLRLRWPYVRRVVESVLAKENWTNERRKRFLTDLEERYKSPFPPVGEETLAGGLSNTIAGRICNQFDLKGGGYTVDGACASSLLAVANACSSLAAGDLDVAIAGGVDLSLDPFEIVGFAKTRALASDEMHVFDQRSAGFWPGEGCGIVVLMRHDDALAQGRRVYAVIRGWGISSDGHGGITRPEKEGQLEALHRAYRRAGFGIETVSYCEGHGTGTAVGDATELEVLSCARRTAKNCSSPAAIGSIKANIGHTKAAGGVAGLIKTAMAVHSQVLPPTTGCEQAHIQLTCPSPALRVLREAELWPHDHPLRASVSAMGFGGINAHVVLESVVVNRRSTLSPREFSLIRSSQDAELFLFAAESPEVLSGQIKKFLHLAPSLSRAEMADSAAQLQKQLGTGNMRAGVIASKSSELVEKLNQLESWLNNSAGSRLDFSEDIFLGRAQTKPRIVFLFPGQGSPARLDGGEWRRRFEPVRELYMRSGLPAEGDTVSTRVMQPAIITASLAGLKMLGEFGIEADSVLGHSLGEITALHWAGAFDEETLLRITRVRGAAMAELGSPTGTMLAIAAPWRQVQELLDGEPVMVVGYNSPRQTVVAGETYAIKKLARLATAKGLPASELPVSHAFHTPLVAAAVPVLAEHLSREKISQPGVNIFSTVTGGLLKGDEDLRSLLCHQVTSPVRFEAALAEMLGIDAKGGGRQNRLCGFDLLIEVGPGAVLRNLVLETVNLPVVALDAGGKSLKGILQAVGAAFVLGAPVKTAALFADRFIRPFALDHKPNFFTNPCELAPVTETAKIVPPARQETEALLQHSVLETNVPITLIRRLVSERAELPDSAVRDTSRMLSDLHLNSITVGQIVSAAARQLGLPHLIGLTDFANASVEEIARALEELKSTSVGRIAGGREWVAGANTWVRAFTVQQVEVKRPINSNEVRNAHCAGIKKAMLKTRHRSTTSGHWQMFTPENHPFAGALHKMLNETGTEGVAVCLSENPSTETVPLLLAAARAVTAIKNSPQFVLVQHGWGGGGFARTLSMENPDLSVSVINVPAGHQRAVNWIAAEIQITPGFKEVHFTKNGRRLEPRLQLVEIPPSSVRPEFPVGPDDVLLVTGGGKGIAAECALALARETGVKLALIGRSDPKFDKELENNFARMTAAGVRLDYFRADVSDGDAVRVATAEIENKLGAITAVLHGAGVNTPQLIGMLDEAAFRRTLEPKIAGVQNVLAALKSERLKLLVTFGSIIARTGLPGEADYATANEWLTALTNDFQTQHPGCRCMALEWSVWSGTGMGERLGRIEALSRQGITAISVDDGVRIFCRLLQQPLRANSLVVTGRFGNPATLTMAAPELPLRRFLEHRRVYYPGVELVVDTEMSLRTDPYLADHILQKQSLLPAVIGLEAMAQVAMALVDSEKPPVFDTVEFLRPVAVPEKGTLKVRLAALRRENGCVEICLRSEETDFQADHFRALCRFAPCREGAVPKLSLSPVESETLALDPQTDLYGRILFHHGRFRRLRGYRLLKAKECIAEITADDDATWFGPYIPADFVLGNPAARDAALHAIQACVPHRRILPMGIERMTIHRNESGPRFVRAKERLRNGNNFIYDVEVTDAHGEVVESWNGLHLRAVEMINTQDPWPDKLLAPYLERWLEEIAVGSNVKVVFRHSSSDVHSGGTDGAIQHALGKTARVWRRPDGKPLVFGEEIVSAAHANDFTLAVAGTDAVACDLEEVVTRIDIAWHDLLGEGKVLLAERIARERGESMDAAATRIWAAMECMKKIGQPANAPLVVDANTGKGWVLLRSGSIMISSCVVAIRENKESMVIAIAFKSHRETPSVPMEISSVAQSGI